MKMRGTVIESEKVLFQTRRYPKPKLGACALGINDDLNSSITEALTFFLPILKRSTTKHLYQSTSLDPTHAKHMSEFAPNVSASKVLLRSLLLLGSHAARHRYIECLHCESRLGRANRRNEGAKVLRCQSNASDLWPCAVKCCLFYTVVLSI